MEIRKRIGVGKMKFMEAVQAMKEGKKVRRHVWIGMGRCDGITKQ